MSTKNNLSPLSDEEMDELAEFLLSDETSDETMMPDRLDGYLTALVTSPAMPPASVWLPKVWGVTENDETAFSNYAQVEHITGLIMRHMSSLIMTIQENPEACEPIFDSAVYPDSTREYVDGEMWAYGFMTGINLQRQDWQPVFEEPEKFKILRPIYLLGTEDLTEEEEALIETPEQREKLAMLVPASVAELYHLWAPVRRVVSDPSLRRHLPKIGRSEKCPCGSERKYKKCCGVTTEAED